VRIPTTTGAPRLVFALLLCYGLFFLGYFFVPKSLEGDHYKLYYIVITLLTIPLIPQGIRLIKGDRLFLLCLSYIIYMLASVTWSDAFHAEPTPWREVFDYTKHAFHLLIFILGTRVLMHRLPNQYERMRRVLYFSAGAAGLLTMAYWYSTHDLPMARLEGFSLMRNPNDLAFVYGAICVWGIGYILSTQDLLPRFSYAAVLLALVVLVFLAQSRGTMLGLVCAALVFGLRGHSLKYVILFTGLMGAVAAMAVVMQPQIIDQMLARADSHRFTLWSQILEETFRHPFVGSGYLSNAIIEIESLRFNAHSAYLATLRDGGLIGLSLLLGMLAAAARRAYQTGRQTKDYTWLAAIVFATVFLLAAGDRLLDRPKEVWFAFWLPIAMIIALNAPPHAGRNRER
jgi:O-antigen ligase